MNVILDILVITLIIVMLIMSHFSYAPLFQGPHFLTKMLQSNILYNNLLIGILSVWWHRKKYQNHSCKLFCYVKGNIDKNARATWTSIFSIYASHYPWWLKRLIIDTSYSLGSSDVITDVNTMTPINPLFFNENKRRTHGCLKWNYKRSVLISSLLRPLRNFI